MEDTSIVTQEVSPIVLSKEKAGDEYAGKPKGSGIRIMGKSKQAIKAGRGDGVGKNAANVAVKSDMNLVASSYTLQVRS